MFNHNTCIYRPWHVGSQAHMWTHWPIVSIECWIIIYVTIMNTTMRVSSCVWLLALFELPALLSLLALILHRLLALLRSTHVNCVSVPNTHVNCQLKADSSSTFMLDPRAATTYMWTVHGMLDPKKFLALLYFASFCLLPLSCLLALSCLLLPCWLCLSCCALLALLCLTCALSTSDANIQKSNKQINLTYS